MGDVDADVLVVGANVFNIGADLGSMAEAFRLLVPIPFAVLVIAIAGVILRSRCSCPTSGTR